MLDKDMSRLRYYTCDLLRICSPIYYGNGAAVAMAYEKRFIDGASFEDFGQNEQGLVMEVACCSRFRQRIGTAMTPAVID